MKSNLPFFFPQTLYQKRVRITRVGRLIGTNPEENIGPLGSKYQATEWLGWASKVTRGSPKRARYGERCRASQFLGKFNRMLQKFRHTPLSFFIILTFSLVHAAPVLYPIEENVLTADGFDYPVAKPHAIGYYTSRGWFKYHPGEDWVAADHSRTLLGAPVYSIGIGIVVFTRNAPGGWGNVVIVRHAYYEENNLYLIDSFYAHLNRVTVQEGQFIAKGQQVGEIGTNRGMYRPHLHFEIRKNLLIGINRSGYLRNFNNYWTPTRFIEAHRELNRRGRYVRIQINTFAFQSEFPLPLDESRIHQRRKSANRKRGSEVTHTSSDRNTFRINRFKDLRAF